MPQALVQLYTHIVFSTKSRRPFLKSLQLRNQLHAYLGGICRNLDCFALAIGGVEDHVHLLVRLSKTTNVSTLVRDLKRESSKWIKKHEAGPLDFAWQSGYGAFSISPSHVESVKQYVVDQLEHHKQFSFQDELRRLCAKYGLAIDERYVWD